MLRTYVTLGDHAAAGHQTLILACRHCERHGRYNLCRLIARYGAEMGLPELRKILAAACPKVQAAVMYDQRGVHYPQLAD
jgi:hypothetical protein